MSARNQNPNPNLANWLIIATETLCLPAMQRIKLEITSHFEDAVESGLAEGWSETDAEVKALADLGDPRSAAQRFQKEHLTGHEVGLIQEKFCRNRRGIFWTLMVEGAGLVAVGIYQHERLKVSVLALVLGVVSLILGSLYYFLTDTKKLKADVSNLWLITFALKFNYFPFLCVFFLTGFDLWFAASSSSLSNELGRAPREFRLWLKLRRMADCLAGNPAAPTPRCRD
jgi:hypothetical protein